MKNTLLIAAAITGMMFTSCKKDDIEPNNNNETQGEMTVKMTDAPGDYAALDVEITKVEAFLDNSGWVTLNNQTQTVAVLDLTNGTSTSLASSSSVDAGFYSKLRLTFGNSNNLSVGVGSGMNQFGLNFGTNTQQQVEIVVDEQIDAGSTNEIVLDFNVAESIVELGGSYFIDPAISEIEDTSTGVEGEVDGAIQASVTLTDGNESFSTYIAANGEFMLQGMEDGTYELIVSGIRDGETQVSETTVQNVVVVSGEFTSTGSIQL